MITTLTARSAVKIPTIQKAAPAGKRMIEIIEAGTPTTSTDRQLSGDRLMRDGRDAAAKELIGAYLPENSEEKTRETRSRVFRL